MDQFPGLLPRPSHYRLNHRHGRQQQSPASHLVDDDARKPRGLGDGLRDRHGERDQRVEIRTTENEMTEAPRSEEHTSELQSLMRISYAVFCLKKKKKQQYRKI